MMNVYFVNVLNGLSVFNVSFIVIMLYGKNCDNVIMGFIDFSDGMLVMGGMFFGFFWVLMMYQGMIDVEGNVMLVIEQLQGVGLLMLLSVLLVNLLIIMFVNCSVKFIVFISFDMLEVQMWGYMVDMFIVSDMEFQWLKLVVEVIVVICIQEQDNEIWVCVSYVDVLNNFNVGGCEVGYLLCVDQFVVLYVFSDGNKIYIVFGWLMMYDYWFFIFVSVVIWQVVLLVVGGYIVFGDVLDYVSCLVSKNLMVVFIIIELVDVVLWYNVNSEYVVKVKKGDMFQFKVMVKDVSGNLLL